MAVLKFSVIIPAFNVQGYLRQCVQSVLDQGVAETEIILVDDCSTDATAALCDELAAQHASVNVLRPSQNVGLGEARNLGIDGATGDYLVFLDGDDYLAPGALLRISQRLELQPVDVVIFNYARLYPDGKSEPGVMNEPLQGDDVFTLVERPQILDVLNVAWNKVYRRAFIEEHVLRFPKGYYEDIPWTYPVFGVAQSVISIDEVLYLYRQRWSGSILRSTDVRHFEIIDQFERLAAKVRELDLRESERHLIYHAAFRNIVTLVTSQRGRLPDGRIREYYTKARAAVRANVDPSYTPPTAGSKSRYMRWMWSMDFRKFELAWRTAAAARSTRAAGLKVMGPAIKLARKIYHSQYSYRYFVKRTSVSGDIAVFENLWGRSPRLNCLAVYEQIHKEYPHMRCVFLMRADQTNDVPPGVEYAVHNTNKYYKLLAQAKYFFLDVNLPGWWHKRDGQVFTQLHHGTPLKSMGVEERGKSRRWKRGLLTRCARWDYSLVSNSYSAEVWKHSYPVKVQTLEYGYPRNDVLVDANAVDVARARGRLGIPDDHRVVLYMPTYRDSSDVATYGVDIEELAAELDERTTLLVRGHYFYGGSQALAGNGRLVDVSTYPSVEDLYLAADLMVGDYSSAMFDFANLGRPIVLFPYDWNYYRVVRGTYFDITVDAPGEVVRTIAQLADALRNRSYESSDAQERLAKFRSIFCEFDDGHAAERIVAKVLRGEEPEPVQPIAGAPAYLATWNTSRVA